MYKIVNILYENNEKLYYDIIKLIIDNKEYIDENYSDISNMQIDLHDIIIQSEYQYLYLIKYPLFAQKIKFKNLSDYLKLKYIGDFPEEYYIQNKEFYINYITNKYFCAKIDWVIIIQQYYQDEKFIELLFNNNLITWSDISSLSLDNDFIIKNKNNLILNLLKSIEKLPLDFLYEIKNYINWNNYNGIIPVDIIITNFSDIPISKYYFTNDICKNKELHEKMVYKALRYPKLLSTECIILMYYEQYETYKDIIKKNYDTIKKIRFISKKDYNKFAEYKLYRNFIITNINLSHYDIDTIKLLSKKFRKYIIDNVRIYPSWLFYYYDYDFPTIKKLLESYNKNGTCNHIYDSSIYYYTLENSRSYYIPRIMGYNISNNEFTELTRKYKFNDKKIFKYVIMKERYPYEIITDNMRYKSKKKLYEYIEKKYIIIDYDVCFSVLLNSNIDEYIIEYILNQLNDDNAVNFIYHKLMKKYAFKLISEKHNLSFEFIKKYHKNINIKKIKINDKIYVSKDIAKLLRIEIPLKSSLVTIKKFKDIYALFNARKARVKKEHKKNTSF